MKITKGNVEYYINIVNNLLTEFRVNYQLEFNSRNGYKAIDKKLDHGANTLATGLTTKEAYLIIHAIFEVLNDMKERRQ